MNKREEYIQEHHEFYIAGYRKLINFLFILLSIVFLLLALIIYQHYTRQLPKYFATTTDGRLVEMVPYDKK